MFRGRRASFSGSTPSLSFFSDASASTADFSDASTPELRQIKRKSLVDGSGFMADFTDAGTMRRKSLADGSGFAAKLKDAAALRRKSLSEMPLLSLPSPKATAMSFDLANDSPKTMSPISPKMQISEESGIVSQAIVVEESGIVSQAIVVEDEQTALAHCEQARWHAKKSLISAMRGRASELAEAIAYARSQGVDNNTLVKAEATFKQRKATEVRNQCTQKRCSSVALPLPEVPDLVKHKAKISKEAQAVLDGMMEAQTIISGGFEGLAVPLKSLHPSMQRRRRQSVSMTDIRVR